MKYDTITVNGYWADSKEPFQGMTVALGSWDGEEDAADEKIFFYLDDKPPVGDQGEFVITEVLEVLQ